MAPSTPTLPTGQTSDLGRMLSINAVVSIATSFFGQEAVSPSEIRRFTKIGAGTCGTVFAIAGSDLVVKVAKHHTSALTGDLFNDGQMHQAVSAAMQSIGNGVNFPRVPYVHSYIPASNEAWWQTNTTFSTALTENNHQTPQNTLCSERIAPLPIAIRSRLIELYCPENLKSHAHQDVGNKDCLVRVYLGARRRPDGPQSRFFSLRNYKLHLNQMLDLGMDVKELARIMAGGLAVMHWTVRIDAKDIEFVLGSSPEQPRTADNSDRTAEDMNLGPKSSNIINWRQRSINLWLLDFNLCSRITMDDSGIAMAAKAWEINDPYYPKPGQSHSVDQELWNVFVSRYIEISDQILESTPALARLPREFIASITRIQRKREKARVR